MKHFYAIDARVKRGHDGSKARVTLNASLLDRYGEVLNWNGDPSGSVTQETGRALFRDDDESKSFSFKEIDAHLSVVAEKNTEARRRSEAYGH
jgi:hypothetical protein